MKAMDRLAFGWKALVFALQKRRFYLRHVPWLRRQVFGRRFSQLVLEGPERSSGMPISVLYVGEGSSLSYLRTLFFRAEPKETLLRRFSLLQALRGDAPAPRGYDLRICEYTPRMLRIIRPAFRFRVPEWIEQEIALDGTWQDVLDRFRSNTRSTDLRMVRKYNFGHDIVRDRASIEYFYDHLYLPHINRRFEESAEIIGREWLIAVAQNGGLLRILNGTEVIAGAVVHYGKDMLDWIWVGALAQQGNELSKGTFSSLYYHSIRHAHEGGFRKMIMGNTRPFLTDGVYRYKRKWGARVVQGRYADTRFLFDVDFGSDAARRWLESSPFLTEQADGLYANVFSFADSPDGAGLAGRLKELMSPGIEGINLYSARAIEPLPDGIGCPIRRIEIGSATSTT